MHDLVNKIRSELIGVWRFRRYGLAAAWLVCLLGWPIVLSIPDEYQAHARVNVDTKTALRPLLEGIAVEPDLETQLNLVRQVMLGSANIENVARKVGFDLTGVSAAERDALLGELTQRIELTLEPPTVRDPRIPNTLYRITYTDDNRQRALQVVDVLLNSFVEGTFGSERSGTVSAQRFLREQLTDYGRRLAEAEARLAEFKKRNVGLVPGEEGDYFSRMQAAIREIDRIEGQLAVAASRRTELQRQLRGEIPFVPTPESVSTMARGSGPGQPPQDTAGRIQETQARLDEMLLRFTDRHPDVIAARETLEQLRQRQKEELDAIKRGDVGAAAVARASANPVYQNIQLQLNEADVQIASLRGELEQHKNTQSELRRLVDTVPEVEQEYARLTRDYDVTKTQYNELLQRLERANVSGGAEQSGVAKFNIVDPPAVGFRPVFPNRPLFLTGVLIAALGLGVAIAYVMHMLKPVFVDSKQLAAVTGVPVLGSLARTWVELQAAETRRGLLRYCAASAMLVVVYVAALVLQQPASQFLRQALS